MKEQWSTSQEDEDLYRRRLFAKAGKGDAKSTKELQETYGLRFWSAQERLNLASENPYFNRKARRSQRQQRTTAATKKERKGNSFTQPQRDPVTQ
jgi:hypothetical protein